MAQCEQKKAEAEKAKALLEKDDAEKAVLVAEKARNKAKTSLMEIEAEHPILDTRISFVRTPSPSGSGDPPRILKRAGLESSGRMAYS